MKRKQFIKHMPHPRLQGWTLCNQDARNLELTNEQNMTNLCKNCIKCLDNESLGVPQGLNLPQPRPLFMSKHAAAKYQRMIKK
jgi:hypothetical protein